MLDSGDNLRPRKLDPLEPSERGLIPPFHFIPLAEETD